MPSSSKYNREAPTRWSQTLHASGAHLIHSSTSTHVHNAQILRFNNRIVRAKLLSIASEQPAYACAAWMRNVSERAVFARVMISDLKAVRSV